MKNIFSGISFLLSGLLLLSIFLLIVNSNLHKTLEWSTIKGVFWQTALNLKLMPIFLLAIILNFLGSFILLVEVFKNNK